MIIGALSLLAATTIAAIPGAPAGGPAVSAKWGYDTQLIPDNLMLELRNLGDKPVCIPTVELSDQALNLSQNGNRIHASDSPNRAILLWKDADLVDGMSVIPAGRSIQIFYSLTKWPLSHSTTRAQISVRLYDCAEFFTAPDPRAVVLETAHAFKR